ncbi:hypothetical protein H310_00579 [Aphanomyces invadans]|uniref:Mitochondrial carrier protein n=1 Tax=Aphanomyces invadans TaxID=157072 RepID=A0A024UUM4_9STRA|nr:hypothetical protein H310_00579 [Aphanomyces invadans]ETW10221.1 hypothetical protein H310_00579 [Aphanomyces invadans]|eukprot:XP_008861632.1 hypothetical protein H310_00579 [Aphanomyces invadans]
MSNSTQACTRPHSAPSDALPHHHASDHGEHPEHGDHHLVWCPRHNHYYDDRKVESFEEIDDTAELSPLRDFIAGSCAGVSSTVVGHPFDTVKVRLQMNCPSAPFKGPMDCVMQTVQKEGFWGLYKGMVSPMTTVPLVNAVVFSAYEHAKAVLLTRRLNDTSGVLMNHEAMMAGAWAGFVNSIVVTPVELVKCHLQAQGEAIHMAKDEIKFHGTLDCVKKIIQIDGMRGLWRGHVATMVREVPSYVGQFGTYELLQRVFSAQLDGENDKASTATTLLAGGFAGCVCWTVSYPQDVIKSRLQLQPLGHAPLFAKSPYIPDGGFMACAKAIVREQGWRGLWRGYTPCLLRAFPSNAAGFATYEMVKSVFFMDKENVPLPVPSKSKAGQ